jgi:uncharacterized membrane protein YccF (DUF307 family)
MAVSGPTVVLEAQGPSLLARVVYFVLVGWWLGGLLTALAWLLLASVIGLPIGVWLLNRLPTFVTLRPQEQGWRLEEGVWRPGPEQREFVPRALWFVFVGWWLSALWLAIAYAALVTIIGLPIAFWMYERVGAVTTLYRS